MTLSYCFRILGIPKNSCINELKIAYRYKAKMYHPDRNGGDGRQFNKLHEAYTFLLDSGSLHRGTVRPGSDILKRKAAVERQRQEFRKKAEEKTAKERAQKLAKDKSPSHKVFTAGDILIGNGSDWQKKQAIQSLINLGRKSSYPFLKTALYGGSEIIVLTAIDAIGKLKIMQAGPELSSLMHSGSVKIRMAVLLAVESMDSKKYYRDIVQMAVVDSDIAVRHKAATLFQRFYE